MGKNWHTKIAYGQTDRGYEPQLYARFSFLQNICLSVESACRFSSVKTTYDLFSLLNSDWPSSITVLSCMQTSRIFIFNYSLHSELMQSPTITFWRTCGYAPYSISYMYMSNNPPLSPL